MKAYGTESFSSLPEFAKATEGAGLGMDELRRAEKATRSIAMSAKIGLALRQGFKSWRNQRSASQEPVIRAFQDEACQPTRCIGAGIDIDAVGQNVGLLNRSMAVHHDLAEALLVQQEFLSDPY